MPEVSEDTDARSDSELVDIARRGDRDVFGSLIERHYRKCVNLATLIMRNRTEAQDVVQKAVSKAFAHLDQYQGAAEFSSWLLRIVENECLMLIRLKKRMQFLYLDADSGINEAGPVELPAEAADPEHDVIKQQLVDLIQREVRRIPPLLSNVLVLHDIQRLHISDVADRLGISVPAAKSRLLRARHELRGRLLRFSGPSGHRMAASRVRTLPAKSVRSVPWGD